MTDFAQALVAELAKKSGLIWVSYGGHAHPIWHEWVGDAVCVVAGGGEQPLPDIASQQTVTLLLRSKTTRFLIAEAEATVEVTAPGSEHWEVVTSALKSGRLNVVDRSDAVERWAREATVVRLIPTGDVRQAEDISQTIGQSRPHLSRR
ncbi:MAG: hypothetical protein ABIR57_00225 [Aeromicrobium sp.]